MRADQYINVVHIANDRDTLLLLFLRRALVKPNSATENDNAVEQKERKNCVARFFSSFIITVSVFAIYICSPVETKCAY